MRVKKLDLAEQSLLTYTESEPIARSFVQLAQFYLANDRPEDAEKALKTAKREIKQIELCEYCQHEELEEA